MKQLNTKEKREMYAFWSSHSLIERVFVVILAIIMGSTLSFGQANWNNMLDDWDPLLFEGVANQGWESPGGAYQWNGPVVADLDQDGEKEVIFADCRQVFVYGLDGTRLDASEMRINDNDWDQGSGFSIRSIPSVGDLDGNGTLDIVFTGTDLQFGSSYFDCGHAHCNPNQQALTYHLNPIAHARTKVYAYSWDGEDFTSLANPVEIALLKAETPVLADMDCINGVTSFEDNRMEIILYGWSCENHVDNWSSGEQECPYNGSLPHGNDWKVVILQLNNNSLNVLGNDEFGFTTRFQDGGFQYNDYHIPSVGDMNRDGKKEICLTYRSPSKYSPSPLIFSSDVKKSQISLQK